MPYASVVEGKTSAILTTQRKPVGDAELVGVRGATEPPARV